LLVSECAQFGRSHEGGKADWRYQTNRQI